MRIALLCHNYAPHLGGIELVVENLGRRLALSNDVAVVSTAWRGNAGVTQEHGMTVHRLPALHVAERRGVPYPIPLGPGVREAIRALAQADVLHAHGSLYPTTLLGMAVARTKRIPFVVTEHVGLVSYRSSVLERVQRGAWAVMGKPVLRSAAAVTVLNARIADWLRTQHESLAPRLIANGVDFERFRPLPLQERQVRRAALGIPPDGPVALFVGRNNPKKNLDAVLRIPRESFHLVVCGDGRDLSGDRLIEVGIMPHHRMADIYACADVLVHAGTGEGFPLTVQEAMACGVPVVLLWDEGYSPSLSTEIVVACDSFTELGRETIALLADPARRASLSERARSFAQRHWSWERATAEYASLYEECVLARAGAVAGAVP